MSGINFIGSYSGIDQSVIDQLMEVERLPLRQYESKKSSITQKQNAWKDINTRLNNLFNKLKTLQSKDTFTAKTAKSSNEEIVAVSTSNKAVEGTYDIEVKKLATNTKMVSSGINTDSFTIEKDEKLEIILDGDEENKIEIDVKAGDSLKDIVSKINSFTRDSGISATLINNNEGSSHLVLTDIKGAREITLKDEEGLLNQLGLANPDKYEKGQEAQFIINGVEVKSSTNTITDVVEGLTIDLKKASAGQSVRVTVGIDYEKVEKAIKEFVDQYNSTMTFIEEKLAAGNPDIAGSGGVLAGDGTLMRLHSSLRNFVTSSLFKNDYDGYKDISQLGVTTIDKYGQLQFDASKLREALEENPDKVMEFFFGIGEGEEKVEGFVDRLNNYIDSFISTKNGIIKNKNESYDKVLKDLNRQIERFNDRMEKKEEQYIRIFTALDMAMMQAESQMNWLVGQIDALNASASVRK